VGGASLKLHIPWWYVGGPLFGGSDSLPRPSFALPFHTCRGGNAPSYVYRLISELYHADDRELWSITHTHHHAKSLYTTPYPSLWARYQLTSDSTINNKICWSDPKISGCLSDPKANYTWINTRYRK